MQETEHTKSSESFKQGDILRFEQGTSDNAHSEFGIIINADCDLAHGKIDGVISYLPLYHIRAYLSLFWAPDFVSQSLTQSKENVKEICDIKESDLVQLISWLEVEDLNTVVDRITQECNLSSRMSKKLATHLEKIRICTHHGSNALEAFEKLSHLDKSPQTFSRNRLRQALDSMGDGHFFISELIGDRRIGFVVRMRRIYSVDAACCFASVSEQMAATDGENLTGVRIARLASPYRYRLAQLFGYQFSRIGLPDERHELSSLVIDDLVTQFVGG